MVTAPIVVDSSRAPHAKHRMLPITAVRFDDPVLAPRIKVNREVSIPEQLRLLETTGRMDNFRKTIGTVPGTFEGFYFNDSDVYKWLEAAAWSLATNPDQVLQAEMDRVIEVVGAAQQPDGYLDNFYTAADNGPRWSELVRTHELYCLGHLIQAAIAHQRSTGS